MAFARKILSTALVAATLAGSAVAATSSAEARGYGRFWGGVAVGAGLGIIASQAYRPVYAAPVYAAPVYSYYPSCRFVWRTDYYGNSYKVKVCG
jgi:hypothetical protein